MLFYSGRHGELYAGLDNKHFPRYNVVNLYNNWQGTNTGVALMTLQPGVFGEEYYFASTLILVFGLVFAVLFFSKTLLRDYLDADVWQWLAISIPPLAVCIQTMSNSRDSFLWYN